MSLNWIVGSFRASASFVVLSLVLTGCGGGSSGGSSVPGPGTTPTPPGPPISAGSASGVVATGKPLAGTLDTLKDATGTARTATTASDGSYTIATAGLTGPFFTTVTTSAGVKLYSVSADTNAQTIVNITPLTDVIVRTFYGVQGASADTAFASPTGTNAAPGAAPVGIITNVINAVCQLWNTKAGVSTSGYSPISTPLVANGTGADLVLSQTVVNQATGQVKISDGTTTQTSTLTYGSGTVTVATSTVGATGTSTSTTTTVVPVTSGQVSAQNAIAALLANFSTVVNAKGPTLAVGDILPFLDPGLINDGQNAAGFAANIVAGVGGATLAFGTLQFVSIDTTKNTAEVLVAASITKNGQVQKSTLDFFFKLVGSAWLLGGNGRFVRQSVQAEARTNQAATAGGNGPAINVDTQPLQNAYTAASITGGGFWNSTALYRGATIVRDVVFYDHFVINSGPLTQLPAAGTVFTITYAGSTPVSQQTSLNAFTTELIRITSPTSFAVADAKLGSTLTVAWTLPTTYPIARINLSGLVFTGNQSDPATFQCNVDGNITSLTATSGTLSLPTTCNGKAVTQVNLNLSTDGSNGDRSIVIYMLN